jgi:hypothetical protein
MEMKLESALSRRRTLQLIALGLSGTAAGELLAKQATKVSPQQLETASGLVDGDFNSKQLNMVAPALQQNLYQFAIVRELEIDDLIEPALLLSAKWK